MVDLNDPSLSDWLKQAVTDLENRDPVDAYNDALLLAKICKQRADAVIAAAQLTLEDQAR